MYTVALTAHSWLRWAALIAGVVATLMVFMNRPAATGRPVAEGVRGSADRWGLLFMITLDLQTLLGLLLYVALSPNTRAIFQNFGAAMQDPAARFWAVEHVTLMLAAVVLVHLGRILARKAATAPARRTRMLVCFALATIAMFAATPWPGMASGRPLFRV